MLKGIVVLIGLMTSVLSWADNWSEVVNRPREASKRIIENVMGSGAITDVVPENIGIISVYRIQKRPEFLYRVITDNKCQYTVEVTYDNRLPVWPPRTAVKLINSTCD